MRAFEVRGESSEQFVARIRAEVRSRGLEDMIRVEHRGDRIEVRVSYLGRSSATFTVDEGETGFAARLDATRVSAMHAVFRGRADRYLDEIMRDLGALPLEV